MMLVDISTKLQEASVIELLEYAVYSDPEELKAITQQYSEQGNHILYAFEDQEEYVALIGATRNQDIMEIKHLVVRPEDRMKGYGRGIIVELILKEEPAQLQAVVDDTAVDFFRNLGFQVIDHVDSASGAELYRCIYDAHNEDEE